MSSAKRQVSQPVKGPSNARNLGPVPNPLAGETLPDDMTIGEAKQLGVRGDTELIHANPLEKMFLKIVFGGEGSTNTASGFQQFPPAGGQASHDHDAAAGAGGGTSGGGDGGPGNPGGSGSTTSKGGVHSSPEGAGGSVSGHNNANNRGENSAVGGGLGADPNSPSMGTSIGGMGISTKDGVGAGYGPEASGKEHLGIGGFFDHLGGMLGLSDGFSHNGETVGQIDRSTLDPNPQHAANINKAMRESLGENPDAATDEDSLGGFVSRMGTHISNALKGMVGIGAMDPTTAIGNTVDDPDTQAPAITGQAVKSFDPIGAALGLAGSLPGPIGSIASIGAVVNSLVGHPAAQSLGISTFGGTRGKGADTGTGTAGGSGSSRDSGGGTNGGQGIGVSDMQGGTAQQSNPDSQITSTPLSNPFGDGSFLDQMKSLGMDTTLFDQNGDGKTSLADFFTGGANPVADQVKSASSQDTFMEDFLNSIKGLLSWDSLANQDGETPLSKAAAGGAKK